MLLRSNDVVAARTALRHAKFNPAVYGLRLGTPPSNAPDLDYKIAVHEPEAWPQSMSDEDRIRRIADVLGTACIRARAGGVDARPTNDETTAANEQRSRQQAAAEQSVGSVAACASGVGRPFNSSLQGVVLRSGQLVGDDSTHGPRS